MSFTILVFPKDLIYISALLFFLIFSLLDPSNWLYLKVGLSYPPLPPEGRIGKNLQYWVKEVNNIYVIE